MPVANTKFALCVGPSSQEVRPTLPLKFSKFGICLSCLPNRATPWLPSLLRPMIAEGLPGRAHDPPPPKPPAARSHPPLIPLLGSAVSPLVGNCRELLEMLRAESMTISKLVYVAFNPTLPPPLQADSGWLSQGLGAQINSQDPLGPPVVPFYPF